MQNQNWNPDFYYLVQGRDTTNSNNYIEQCFANINPFDARRRAFDYIEYLIQLLQKDNKLQFLDRNDVIQKNEVQLENINRFKVFYSENNVSQNGIALYLVLNKNMSFIKKTTGCFYFR